MKNITLLLLLLGSGISAADIQWSPSLEVSCINPGGNGGDGTLICLKDYTFSSPDCANKHAAFIGVDSKDFDAILSVALAAKMSGKQVKIFYSGCSNNYPRIKEIAID